LYYAKIGSNPFPAAQAVELEKESSETRSKGHIVNALALAGEEGRDKLR
jgi:hypothetical protein